MNSLEKARETINRVDSEMAALFTERMRAAELVAAYKKEHGLPITDAEREAAVIRNGAQQVDDPILREYYVRFIQETMALSRAYQSRLLEGMRVAYSGTEVRLRTSQPENSFRARRRSGFPISKALTARWRTENATQRFCLWRTAPTAKWDR